MDERTKHSPNSGRAAGTGALSYLSSVLPHETPAKLESRLVRLKTGGDPYYESFLEGGLFEQLRYSRSLPGTPRREANVRKISSAEACGDVRLQDLPPRDY
jgi:hypothetical protein